MRSRTKKTLLATVIVISFVFFVWGIIFQDWLVKPSGSSKEQTLKIALIISKNGFGEAIYSSASLAVLDLNENGNEYQYELLAKDHGQDLNKAREIAQNLMKEENIIAVVGDTDAQIVSEVAKVFQGSDIPFIHFSSSNKVPSGENIFRAAYTEKFQGKELADLIINKSGFDKIAVVWDEEDYFYGTNFEGVITSFVEAADQAGAVIVNRYGDELNFAISTEEIKEGDPESVLIVGSPFKSASALKEIKDAGLNSFLVMGGISSFIKSFSNFVGQDYIENVIFLSPIAYSYSRGPKERVSSWWGSYENSFPEFVEMKQTWVAPYLYDLLYVVIGDTIKQVDVSDADIFSEKVVRLRDTIKNVFSNVEIAGLITDQMIRFNDEGNILIEKFFWESIDREGQFILIDKGE